MPYRKITMTIDQMTDAEIADMLDLSERLVAAMMPILDGKETTIGTAAAAAGMANLMIQHAGEAGKDAAELLMNYANLLLENATLLAANAMTPAERQAFWQRSFRRRR